jgi:hypothetical protein
VFPVQLQFEAMLIRPDGIGNWTYVTVPFSVEEVFGSRGQVKVKGAVNDIPYRGSLMPLGEGAHYLVVNKAIRDAAKVVVGNLVKVSMELDTNIREVEVPEDFLVELDGNNDAKVFFNKLSYSHKKEYVSWIEDAKKLETRRSRITKAIGKLEARLKLK